MSTGRSIPDSHGREILPRKSIAILHYNNEHIPLAWSIHGGRPMMICCYQIDQDVVGLYSDSDSRSTTSSRRKYILGKTV